MFDFIKEIKRKREEKKLEQERQDLEQSERDRLLREARQQQQIEAEIKRKEQEAEAKKKKCPYCQFMIEKEHKGKFKCPSCKNEIFIISEGNSIRLITDVEKENLRLKRKEITEKNKYFRFFEGYIDDKDYLEEQRLQWLKKFPYNGNYDDLTWSLAHRVLQTSIKQNDFNTAQSIYFSLARFQYEQDKPFFKLLQEANRMTLYNYKYGLPENIKIEVGICGCGDSCPACKELDNKWFSVDEALELMPIPSKDCSQEGGWCRCSYVSRVIR